MAQAISHHISCGHISQISICLPWMLRRFISISLPIFIVAKNKSLSLSLFNNENTINATMCGPLMLTNGQRSQTFQCQGQGTRGRMSNQSSELKTIAHGLLKSTSFYKHNKANTCNKKNVYIHITSQFTHQKRLIALILTSYPPQFNVFVSITTPKRKHSILRKLPLCLQDVCDFLKLIFQDVCDFPLFKIIGCLCVYRYFWLHKF